MKTVNIKKIPSPVLLALLLDEYNPRRTMEIVALLSGHYIKTGTSRADLTFMWGTSRQAMHKECLRVERLLINAGGVLAP